MSDLQPENPERDLEEGSPSPDAGPSAGEATPEASKDDAGPDQTAPETDQPGEGTATEEDSGLRDDASIPTPDAAPEELAPESPPEDQSEADVAGDPDGPAETTLDEASEPTPAPEALEPAGAELTSDEDSDSSSPESDEDPELARDAKEADASSEEESWTGETGAPPEQEDADREEDLSDEEQALPASGPVEQDAELGTDEAGMDKAEEDADREEDVPDEEQAPPASEPVEQDAELGTDDDGMDDDEEDAPFGADQDEMEENDDEDDEGIAGEPATEETVLVAAAEAPSPVSEPEDEAVPAEEPESTEAGPIQTAIVGYGGAGRRFHGYLISQEPGLELTAVSSRDPGRRQAAAEEYGVKTYETIDELLEKDEAKLVIIATPHDSHADLAVKALEAGKHVVTDKAMCLKTDEADRMIEAAESNRVMLSVFHNRRWDGDYLTLRKTIDSGLIGQVFLIEECVMGYHQPGGWRGNYAQGGGPLYDWGAHLVDHAVQIAGCPTDWVFCDSQRHKWSTDVPEYVKCLIKFRSGLLYTVEVGYLSKYSKPKFFALGTEGAFRKEGLDPQEACMIQGRIQDAVEDPANRAYVKTTINGLETESRPQTVAGDWCAFYRNIAAHLRDGEELAVKARDVREDIRIMEAAARSAEEKQVIYL